MPRAGRPWTRKEIAFLEGNVNRLKILAIAQALGRTKHSIDRKVRDLKLRGGPKKPRAERLPRERGEMTIEKMERANQLHLADLKKAGHTWWHRVAAAEADTLPSRVPSTFSHFSCIGSPAALCAE